jgi:hypothetical protein
MKTRSSSGVGNKIDLGFDVDSLRIFDLDEDDEGDNYQTSSGSSTIMDTLKRSSSNTPAESREDPTEGSSIGKVRAETDSTKLRQFLNNLPGDE